ncbi:hypothetical protein [Streptomyces sp. NBRC 110028]|uniref:hypothetical protein n=1 Tax=Streptomyces sp. NBRC 110028 TaxID=1621260 RepID=UPI0006E39018|nr:hypothetical protein [Streptomyces sp. NBRC 110028]
MADDHRYSWLDDKAAERLLRGEPVEGRHGTPDDRSDRPHAEAERLAAVLGAVAQLARRPDGAAPGGTAPLPGEEAAVAAFRAARAKPTVVPMSAEDQVGAELTRIARSGEPAAAPAGRRTGWRGMRRPLRAGMVAAVAACTLSGFAVAAAAGVLPFGHGDGTPGPGASVSDTGPGGGESARPEISGGGGSSTSPDGTGGGTSEGPQGRGVPGGDEGHGKDKRGKHGKHGKRDGRGDQGKGEKGVPGAWKTGTGQGKGNGQRARGACRRYLAAEAGTGPAVGKNALNKLTRAAGSRSGIHDYCVRLVGAGTVPRGRTNGTDDSGSGEDGSSHPAPPPPSDRPSGDEGGTPSPESTTSGTSSQPLSGARSGSTSDSASDSPSGAPSAQQSDSAEPAKSEAP